MPGMGVDSRAESLFYVRGSDSCLPVSGRRHPVLLFPPGAYRKHFYLYVIETRGPPSALRHSCIALVGLLKMPLYAIHESLAILSNDDQFFGSAGRVMRRAAGVLPG